MIDLRGNPRGKRMITPELIRAVTDRVYLLLVRELRLERERRRMAGKNLPRGG